MVLPGFLSVEMFDDLLREADVVMGLTREEGIQLSVCNEALGFARPLVTSDTKILRKLFGSAAVLVNTKDPISIAAGCREALEHASEYAKKSMDLSLARIEDWKANKLTALATVLKSHQASTSEG
jgi:trehalose-6-phosphate synthase